jgi:transcription elongation factor SPT4
VPGVPSSVRDPKASRVVGDLQTMADAEQPQFEHADVADSMKGMRACLGCSLVKTFNQFYDIGCENCPFLEMSDDSKRVHECTTAYFEGMIAMMEPSGSWVGRWQQLAAFLPGMYAVQTVGELPKADIDMCKAQGLHYRASGTAASANK